MLMGENQLALCSQGRRDLKAFWQGTSEATREAFGSSKEDGQGL